MISMLDYYVLSSTPNLFGSQPKWSENLEPYDIFKIAFSDVYRVCIYHIISLQIIQLVEGKASAYVFASPGCKKWDTCAPEALLHAVGGMTNLLKSVYTKLELYFVGSNVSFLQNA